MCYTYHWCSLPPETDEFFFRQFSSDFHSRLAFACSLPDIASFQLLALLDVVALVQFGTRCCFHNQRMSRYLTCCSCCLLCIRCNSFKLHVTGWIIQIHVHWYLWYAITNFTEFCNFVHNSIHEVPTCTIFGESKNKQSKVLWVLEFSLRYLENIWKYIQIQLYMLKQKRKLSREEQCITSTMPPNHDQIFLWLQTLSDASCGNEVELKFVHSKHNYTWCFPQKDVQYYFNEM